MLAATLRALEQRLARLERTAVRYRAGVVTDASSLDVTLGGADTPYTAVARLGGPALPVGQQVAALLWGNDMLVLGGIGSKHRAGGGRFTQTGSGVTLNAGSDVTSVSRQAVGVTRVVLTFNSAPNHTWVNATVEDNAGWMVQLLPVSNTPCTFDLYVFSHAGVAADRTVVFTYLIREA